MLRQITTHQTAASPSKLNIHVVTDNEGKGNKDYLLTGIEEVQGLPEDARELPDDGYCVLLQFQNGTTKEVGVNGISNEALIAVVKDRLEHFQQGDYVSMWNGIAIEHLEKALDALHARTENRVARGVEGTYAI